MTMRVKIELTFVQDGTRRTCAVVDDLPEDEYTGTNYPDALTTALMTRLRARADTVLSEAVPQIAAALGSREGGTP